MIVEDQLDRGIDRIGGVEKREEFDEIAAAVAILDQGMALPYRNDRTVKQRDHL